MLTCENVRYVVSINQTDAHGAPINRAYIARRFDSARAAHSYAKTACLVCASSGKPPKKRPHAEAVPGTEKTEKSDAPRVPRAPYPNFIFITPVMGWTYRVMPCIDSVAGIDAMARTMTRAALRLLLDKTSADNISARELLERMSRAMCADTVTDYDAQDCISAATCAIWDCVANGEGEEEAARMAIKAVYRHIRGERGYMTGKGVERLLSIDALTEDDMTYFGKLSYTERAIDEMQEDENARLVRNVARAEADTQAAMRAAREVEGAIKHASGARLDSLARDYAAHTVRAAHGLQAVLTATQAAHAARLVQGVNTVLTPVQRQIITLRAEGLTQAQIARVTERGESTISRNLSLARAALCAYVLDHDISVDNVDLTEIARAARAVIARREKDSARKYSKRKNAKTAQKRAEYELRIVSAIDRAEKRDADKARATMEAHKAEQEREEKARAARMAACVAWDAGKARAAMEAHKAEVITRANRARVASLFCFYHAEHRREIVAARMEVYARRYDRQRKTAWAAMMGKGNDK